MFEPRIKIDRGLYERLKKAAETKGYSSVEELVLDVLEKAAAEADGQPGDEEIRKRLKGLGYL